MMCTFTSRPYSSIRMVPKVLVINNSILQHCQSYLCFKAGKLCTCTCARKMLQSCTRDASAQQTVYSLQVCMLEDEHSSGSHVHLYGAHVHIISAHVHIISARANVHMCTCKCAHHKCTCKCAHHKCTCKCAHHKCTCTCAHHKCTCTCAHNKCMCTCAHHKCTCTCALLCALPKCTLKVHMCTLEVHMCTFCAQNVVLPL